MQLPTLGAVLMALPGEGVQLLALKATRRQGLKCVRGIALIIQGENPVKKACLAERVLKAKWPRRVELLGIAARASGWCFPTQD